MCFHLALRGLYSDRVGLLPNEKFELEFSDTVFELFISPDGSCRKVLEEKDEQEVEKRRRKCRLSNRVSSSSLEKGSSNGME